MKLRNKIFFAVMVLIWGSAWPIMKMGLNNAPPMLFVSNRLFLSSLFLLVLCVLNKPSIPRNLVQIKRILIYSAMSTLSFASTTLGLKAQSSGISSVLTYTQPIFIFILAARFLNESSSFQRVLGILLGFSGVAVIFLEQPASISPSALILVFGAFSWAAATVYYKLNLQDHDPHLVNLINCSLASLVFYIVSVLTEPQFQLWDWSNAVILVYAGVGASGIGTTIWLFLLKDEDATSLSGSSLLVPVLALFFGWLLIAEGLDLKSMLGSILVVAGICLVNLNQNKKDKVMREQDRDKEPSRESTPSSKNCE